MSSKDNCGYFYAQNEEQLLDVFTVDKNNIEFPLKVGITEAEALKTLEEYKLKGYTDVYSRIHTK